MWNQLSRKVTFGDDTFAKMVGKGMLNFPGLPTIKDVILRDSLNANLISVDLLCD